MTSNRVADLYAATTTRLRSAEIATPEIDAKLLLCGAANLSGTQLVTDPDKELDQQSVDRLTGFVERRIAREPVHRILGQREFFGLVFELSPGTLEPRPDTETLVELVLDYVDLHDAMRNQLRFADLGAGSGAIALALLHNMPNASAVAVDISEDALETVRRNAERHGNSERLDIVCGNWLEKLNGGFDFVVSNPPYIPSKTCDELEPEVRNHDPRIALDGGADGLDCYRLILSEAASHIVPGGFMGLEIGCDQLTSVTQLAAEHGWQVAESRKDLSGNDRAILLTR